MIVDFSTWSIYTGAADGSGRSEKKWLTNDVTNEIGLFKFNKTQATTENISEKLAEDIATAIGLECAQIDIGIYAGRKGLMSYLINSDEEILIEGINFINKIYPNYNPDLLKDVTNGFYYSIEMVLESLNEFKLGKEFLNVLVFDFLIGNTDRHQNNWAVLENNSQKRWCPLYDNGSSLCSYISEDEVASYLGKDIVRFQSLTNSKSRSRVKIGKFDLKEPTHYEVLKYLKDNHFADIIDLVNGIKATINDEFLIKLLSTYDDNILSEKKKKLIQKYLIEKIMLINEIFGEEE